MSCRRSAISSIPAREPRVYRDTTTNDPLLGCGQQDLQPEVSDCRDRFLQQERELAVISKHLCPSLLAEELAKLERSAEIYITHLKPGEIELTMQEIEDDAGQFRPRMLQNNQVFEF